MVMISFLIRSPWLPLFLIPQFFQNFIPPTQERCRRSLRNRKLDYSPELILEFRIFFDVIVDGTEGEYPDGNCFLVIGSQAEGEVYQMAFVVFADIDDGKFREVAHDVAFNGVVDVRGIGGRNDPAMPRF
jgi:hypothetical protein